MNRSTYIRLIGERFAIAPVVALLGPRQVGKTTLARMFASSAGQVLPDPNYFDLENPLHLARLHSPMLALEPLRGLVIIDEVQRMPDLFPVLRVLADRSDTPARFLILGSASRDLIGQSSQTLAGRISYIEVAPFSLEETIDLPWRRLWVRGGLPRSFLADSDAASMQWRYDYIQAFLERDIPMLGLSLPPLRVRRMWMMLAHLHGQLLNYTDLASSLQISDHTARSYIDLLTSTFMVRQLQPWHQNIAKRQVKRPKVYIRDSGLLHALLGLSDNNQLQVHPRLGASWEGFALEQLLLASHAREGEAFFWAVHQQAELDLLIVRGNRRLGYEIKYTDHPQLTRSMQQACETLQLESLTIVTPAGPDARFDARICVQSLSTAIASMPASTAVNHG